MQDAAAVPVPQQTIAQMSGLGELSQSDLTSLGLQPEQEEDNHMGDTDDIFKQLGETSFELDNFFTEFNATEIKVHATHITLVYNRLHISQEHS